MNYLVKEFGDEKRWVVWRRNENNLKVPYSPFGGKAASDAPATWGTYKEAVSASPHTGIMFTPDQLLLGIDLDHILDKETLKITHKQKKVLQRFLDECDTYTEVSPSGDGLHLYLRLTESLSLTQHKHAPYEIYTSGRYFTFTDQPYKKQKPVRTISSIDALFLLAIIGYPWKSPAPAVNAVEVPSTQEIPDAVLLEKMFSSEHGEKIRALYEGDTSAHQNDTSRADAALCSHLAYWCAKRANQMERLWLQSALGKRKKMQRSDYRARTIVAAIAICKSVYEPPVEIDFLFTKKKTKDGVVKVINQNTENIARVLRAHPEFRGRFRYDAFKNVIEVRIGASESYREMEDNDPVIVQSRISILYGVFRSVSKNMVWDALILVAKENTIDSAADYIKSLTWDGTPRLDMWLHTVYGAPDDELHHTMGANWMKGLVKRLTHPGCKFDYVLVLEGPQGIEKSTSLLTLGGPWYVETTMSTDTKDFFMQFQGKAIIEFSEGETLSRTETKRMKAIITMQSDRYRPSYGRVSMDFPRRCVFAMTTNQEEYLKDETGNRRWLPVKVEKDADIEWLTANREQLFAEAYHRVTHKNETTWEFPQDAMLAAQDARRVHDPSTDAIVDWYFQALQPSDRAAGITVSQAYSGAILKNMPSGRSMPRYEEMAIATVLEKELRLVKRRVMMHGVRAVRWFDDKNTVAAETDRQLASLDASTF